MRKIIYFDNAATTRMDERVLEAMLPYMREAYGNANGKYSIGYEARKAVNEARKRVALLIGAEPDEIYFNSGGTESNNMILSGFLDYGEKGSFVHFEDRKKRKIVSTHIEHKSMLKKVRLESGRGICVQLIKPDSLGRINTLELKNVLDNLFPEKLNETHFERAEGLVSVMLINNETGTEQPVKEMADIVHAHNCIFHTDAVQAIGHMRINVKELGVDCLSASGHKLYGPKGIGFIYIKRGTGIAPMILGGGQENGMRSGTLNVPGIVGLGKACEIAQNEIEADEIKEREAVEYLKRRLLQNVSGSRVNGDGKWILNMSFEGINGTSLALRLDMESICVSTGSACSAGLDERSHVLTAMGLTPEQTDASIRISIGKYNTMEEAEYLAESIERLVEELRFL